MYRFATFSYTLINMLTTSNRSGCRPFFIRWEKAKPRQVDVGESRVNDRQTVFEGDLDMFKARFVSVRLTLGCKVKGLFDGSINR